MLFRSGGAGLGFLWFNTYPAMVFMGDVGALALGAALGAPLNGPLAAMACTKLLSSSSCSITPGWPSSPRLSSAR